MASALKVVQIRTTAKSNLSAWLRESRVHQWAKNVLVFVPLFTFPRLLGLISIANVLILFSAFCAASSAMYIVNDLLDLVADRQHPRKCFRPLASGEMPVPEGLGLLTALSLTAATLAVFLPFAARACVCCYVLVALLYSLYLKRKPIADVMVLSSL